MKQSEWRWRILYLSFYSKDAYRHAAQNWRSFGYLYIPLIVFLFSLLTCISTQLAVNSVISNNIEPIIQRWPTLVVQKGQLSIDRPSPYIIDLGNNAILDFDTTTDAKLPKGKKGFLVSKSEVLMYESPKDSFSAKQILDVGQVSKNGALILDRSFLREFIGTVQANAGFSVLVANCFMMTIQAATELLLMGVIALGLARSNKATLTFNQCLQIGAVAMTPVLVLDGLAKTVLYPLALSSSLFLLLAFACTFFFLPVLDFAIAVAYTVFGTKAVVTLAKEQQAEPLAAENAT